MSSFNLSQWWHDMIDHLFKHPQAETVAHPAIAAVATAAQPTPQPAPPVNLVDHSKDILNGYLGRTAQTDAILDGRVAAARDLPPAGVNNSLDWTAFDGHQPFVNLEPNVPVTATVKLNAAAFSAAGAQPGSFTFGWYQTALTQPCTVTATATDQAGNVVATKTVAGNGDVLPVPCALDTVYTITLTADNRTQWGLAIKP